MRIVKDAQAVRVKLGHTLQREGEALWRLFWQAVNQVNIGRRKADFTRMIEQGKDKLFILLAVHQTLDLFVEILHAHAQTVEAFRA